MKKLKLNLSKPRSPVFWEFTQGLYTGVHGLEIEDETIA